MGVFAFVAIFFNPLAPINLSRDLWLFIDIGAAVQFLFAVAFVAPPGVVGYVVVKLKRNEIRVTPALAVGFIGIIALGALAFTFAPSTKIWYLQQKWAYEGTFAEYNKIPTNANEVKAMIRGKTREEYLKTHTEVDAKLVLTGQRSSFQTETAMIKAVNLVKDNKIDVMNLPIATQYFKEKENIANLNKKNLRKPGFRKIFQQKTNTSVVYQR